MWSTSARRGFVAGTRCGAAPVGCEVVAAMSVYPDGVPGEKALRGLVGGAVLAYWSAVDPEREDEFNRWYTRQHLPERVGIPGFLRGRRYVCTDGAGGRRRTYFTLYEVEGLATLTSDAYMKRLENPSDWSRRVLPWFTRADRTACSVTCTLGRGIGGWAAVVELGPGHGGGDEEVLRSWLTRAALPAAMDVPLVVGAHLCEADAGATAAKSRTGESGVVGTSEAMARWLVLVEAAAPDALDAVAPILCGEDGAGAHGGAGDVTFERCRLLFSLSG